MWLKLRCNMLPKTMRTQANVLWPLIEIDFEDPGCFSTELIGTVNLICNFLGDDVFHRNIAYHFSTCFKYEMADRVRYCLLGEGTEWMRRKSLFPIYDLSFSRKSRNGWSMSVLWGNPCDLQQNPPKKKKIRQSLDAERQTGKFSKEGNHGLLGCV